MNLQDEQRLSEVTTFIQQSFNVDGWVEIQANHTHRVDSDNQPLYDLRVTPLSFENLVRPHTASDPVE